MILVSMRIHAEDPRTSAGDIERRLRECARAESWNVETLNVWQPADEQTIASLKTALDTGVAPDRRAVGEAETVRQTKCPMCGREVPIQGGRLARHHDRVLKRLCKGSGQPSSAS
jgi:hypothetical protein